MKKLTSILLLLTFMACSKSSVEAEPETAPKPESPKYDIVVAADGSGDVTTVQAAFDKVPANSAKEIVIFVKKGSYKQVLTLASGKNNVRLIGEDAKTTVLTFDNYSGKDNGSGGVHTTSTSSSTYIKGTNFIAENITFENAAGPVGQALAIYIEGARSAFNKCRFIGNQDTYYAHQNTLQYLKDCYIEGTVDYIFGGSVAYFEGCELHSLAAGYITAASTPQTNTYGYVFQNCRITAPANVTFKVYLGRPWREYANVVFMNSDLGGHIRPEGWSIWNGNENHLTSRYAEYKNKGVGASTASRVTWSRQLSDTEAQKYSKATVLGTWDPMFINQ